MKLKPLTLLPPLIFFGLAALFLTGMWRDDPNALPSARKGQKVPAVALERLADYPLFGDAELASGEVVLLNFWASWCAPCRVEHPRLQELAAEGFKIYGVNYKDQPAQAMRFLDDLGNPYTAIGADSSGRMAINWGVYGVPETYVIAPDGTIVLRFAGPLTRDIVENTIRPAIAKATAAQ